MPDYFNPLSGGHARSIPQLAQTIQQLADQVGGLSQLARLLGVSRNNVVRYARGEQQPDIPIRQALARLCNDQRDLAFWNAVARGENPTKPTVRR